MKTLECKDLGIRKFDFDTIRSNSFISSLTIFLGNTDEAEEGVWADLYNKTKLVNYLPWGPNRPYSGEYILQWHLKETFKQFDIDVDVLIKQIV